MRKALFALAIVPFLCLAVAAPSFAMPERVVALEGSLAQIWTLSGGTLAGATADAWERGLPCEDAKNVGTVKSPNLEAIVALSPDLVLMSTDIAAQSSLKETFAAMGIPFREERVDAFSDYLSLLSTYCGMTGRADLLKINGTDVEARVSSALAKARGAQTPRVLLLRAYASGVRVKGIDNLAGAMLAELGCENIAGDAPMGDLSLEAVVRAEPDAIFISFMGSEDAARAWLAANLYENPAWKALDAVRAGRVTELPKALFHYKPCQRWDESYEYLWEALYGGA